MFSEPADRPPLLLIASSETIEVLHLNGSRMSARSPVKGSAVVTLDYSYREDTLCWIESRDLSSQLKCSKISRAGKLPEEWTVSIAQYLHSKYLAGACTSGLGLAVENSLEAFNIGTPAEAVLWFFTHIFGLSCSICIYAKVFKMCSFLD